MGAARLTSETLDPPAHMPRGAVHATSVPALGLIRKMEFIGHLVRLKSKAAEVRPGKGGLCPPR